MFKYLVVIRLCRNVVYFLVDPRSSVGFVKKDKGHPENHWFQNVKGETQRIFLVYEIKYFQCVYTLYYFKFKSNKTNIIKVTCKSYNHTIKLIILKLIKAWSLMMTYRTKLQDTVAQSVKHSSELRAAWDLRFDWWVG